MNQGLQTLGKLKQSVWYDNLSKDILADGTLQKLIEQGIKGLTSNPAIFKKSIADSDIYQTDIATLVAKEHSAEQIVEALMLEDVRGAATLLRSVYDRSEQQDGYASIEVLPELAADAAGTIAAAKDYWSKLNLPNIMVKVPATPAGIEAIEELIYAGININVTLIFSPVEYQKVINAYTNGLARRAAENLDISKIHSVASFFISRNDAWINKEHPAPASFTNKVGLANAEAAYKVFAESFASETFGALAAKGANIQRILWASTGVKDSSLDPLYYALNLPTADSVATHPPAVITDLMKKELNGDTLGDSKVSDYQAVLSAVESAGLSLNRMYEELLESGVKSFAESFDQLMTAVREQL